MDTVDGVLVDSAAVPLLTSLFGGIKAVRGPGRGETEVSSEDGFDESAGATDGFNIFSETLVFGSSFKAGFSVLLMILLFVSLFSPIFL